MGIGHCFGKLFRLVPLTCHTSSRYSHGLEIARKILARSADLKVDAAEVYLRSSSAISIEVKDQVVDALDRARALGAGLRVIADGRLGFAFTTDLSDGALDLLARTAATNAGFTEPDPFVALPLKSGEACPTVAIYDPNIPNMSQREQIDRVMALEREAYAVDPRVKRIRKASASFASAETIVMNSYGSLVSYASTACSASIEVVAEDKGESQAGSDYDVKRFYNELKIEETGRRAAQRALELLGAKSIPSVKAPVVLEAGVAQEFLSIMASGFSSENVQKKRSLFSGKLDQQVAASIITIRDDGLLQGGLGTAPADDEAVPMKRKTVVSEGRLALFLYNAYTANKDKTVSTGNGVRSGFKGIPGVGVTNLYIEPGECSLDSLMEQAGSGLLVTEVMGMHTANPISGDFSVGAAGCWIEKGHKAYPVREITIAGNILDIMKNVDAVGGDLLFSGRIGSPSLLLKEISISGK